MKIILLAAIALLLFSGCVGNASAGFPGVTDLGTYDLNHDGQVAYVWSISDMNLTCVETSHSHAIACNWGST